MAWFRFAFLPDVFRGVSLRFGWLHTLERLYAGLTWIRLACLLIVLVAVPLAVGHGPTAVLPLALAWLLWPLLHVSYAPWEETTVHKLMCAFVVPMAMLALCLLTLRLVGDASRPFVTLTLLATVGAALVMPVRMTIDWPLFMCRLQMMMSYAQDDPAARPEQLSADELSELHGGVQQMIAERLRHRSWLLRQLIREDQLPLELRRSVHDAA